MMGRFKHIFLLLLLLLSFCLDVHAQKHNDVILADDHLILLLDLHSPDATIDSLLKTAGIQKPDVKMLKNGNYSSLQKLGWNVLPMDGKLLRIDRSLSDINAGVPKITSQISKNKGRPGYPTEVLYGVNNFARITVHELPNGLTRFFLPGNNRAKRVMLSGSFNNWSTLQGQMLKTDSGWVRDISLEPGIYAYKFIINGHWDIDRNNNLQRDDGVGNTNSIYYRYNFSFKLPGYGGAHRVVVAGSFNNWNAGELIMNNVDNGWELKLYLHDGIHQYRFLVDGKPVTDPANKAIQKDASGNQSSVLSLGESTTFKLNGYENAERVYVAGNFNHWDSDELPLKKVNGVWTLSRTFPAGNYQYKFIVDGKWITDPTNPHFAREGSQINSFFSVKPNHTFRLKGYGNAKRILLTGTFNNWSEDGYTMEHRGDEWIISIRLKPGKYLYKFKVDKEWIRDPDNKLWEQNKYDTGNSVLWIE
jgi:hypothetical protein